MEEKIIITSKHDDTKKVQQLLLRSSIGVAVALVLGFFRSLKNAYSLYNSTDYYRERYESAWDCAIERTVPTFLITLGVIVAVGLIVFFALFMA